MTDYSTKNYKSLLLFGIILLISAVRSHSQTDWTLPLKLCWGINESINRTASDNVSKSTILLSDNSIKSINPDNGQTLWENRYDSGNFSDISFQKLLYFSEINNNKKYIQSVDIYSGLSIWKKEISMRNTTSLYRNDNKIIIEDENGKRIYLNIETGQKLVSDTSLSSNFELFSLECNFPQNFDERNYRLTFQGKVISENLDLIKKNIKMIIPLKQNTFIWSTDDNFVGIYDFVSKKNIWLRKTGGQIADIKISGNTIYIASFDNFVYLLNITDGKFILKRRLDGRVTNTSEIFENRIAVSAYSSNSISILNLRKNNIENILRLSDAQGFAVHQTFIDDKLIVATTSKVLAFSPNCK